MKERISTLLDGRRRRLALGATGAAIAIGFLAISALAVHEEDFQLDGDVIASTTTNVGSTQNFDWDSLFTVGGTKKSPLPAGFTAAGFNKDFVVNTNGSFNSSDTSTYATGSKDTLPISGWQCNKDNNVNSKIDVMNAYAAAYTDPGSGDQIIYFAQERNANTGDANVGFWFLQDDVGCASNGGTVTFSGEHRDGDLFIVSEFSGGGKVSTIQVYRWNGGANGSLGSEPIVQGGDCELTGAGDPVCATANDTTNGTNGTITTPWQTANKQDGVGNSLRIAEFFEGGLNLTKSGLGGNCFNIFVGNTRSSTSLTATLFDFSRGEIGGCTSETVTSPLQGNGSSIPAGGLTIPADPNDAALQVKDSAAIAVSGVSSFDSSVSFHLCGPLAADSTATCSSGGVDIGSTAVTEPGTYESPTATATAAGRYCFRAEFAGDIEIGLPESEDSSAGECFLVKPVKPAISTMAGAGPVDFGQPVTDTATLTGTAHKPGTGGAAGSTLTGSINPTTLGADATGTITFSLYKNDTCSQLATGTGTNPQTVTVSGDGTYGPVSFTPDAPGTYHWVAKYNGDGPNTLASDAGACLDENEDVVVRQIPTSIKTKQSWYPNDTATVTADVGNLAGGGTVRFRLYDNADCTGTALYTETKSISGGSSSETVSTNNTTFAITTGFDDTPNSTKGPFSWEVVYTVATGDTAHLGTQSTCDAEHFDIDYTNDPGPNP